MDTSLSSSIVVARKQSINVNTWVEPDLPGISYWLGLQGVTGGAD